MAFLRTNWTKYPSALNSGKDTGGGQITPAVGGPDFFGYQVSTDDAATVGGANYFAAAAFDLCIGDFIFANCSDAFASLRVLTVDRTVNPATVTTETLGLGTAIGTANIVNGAVTTVKIADANVTLAKLAAGITPSHVIKFGGKPTTSSGVSGSTHVVTLTGAVAATDIPFVSMVDNGTNNVTIVSAVVTTDTLTVTFSGAPGADVVYGYQVIRAAA